MIQKTAEDLEYSELLDQAAEFAAGSVERLLRVAAFAVRQGGSRMDGGVRMLLQWLATTLGLVCESV